MSFKIFPGTITPDKQKVPLMTGWREQASTDPNIIKAWQVQYGSTLHYFGVPTGTVNGILVLDIDIKTNGWQSIKDRNLTIPDTLSQPTLNGGTHFIFKYPNDGKKYGNRVGFIPGCDIRGEGGYIFWYGSTSKSPILDAPPWLFELLDVKPKPAVAEVSNVTIPHDIAMRTLAESLELIRNAPAGESNDTLNRESFKVGQLIASNGLTREAAEQALYEAAQARGKPPYEAKATITSGINGGLKAPLLCPFNEPPPVVQEPLGRRWTPRRFTSQDLRDTSKLRKPQLFRDWSTEDIHLTTADGGTGKTTLKLYEAICLALGQPFLGFECLQKGKTLFVTGEDSVEKLGAMLGAMLRQMGFIDTPNEAIILDSIIVKKDTDLCLITKDRLGFLHPNGYAMELVKQAVDDIKPKMIVFDPIASFWGSESALNDMNKAVNRFMGELVTYSNACVEMINHMGKQSSSQKDMSQFAGRGGSGLPSNSRVSRVLRSVNSTEYMELTGLELQGDTTAMMCNVNKFTDGSILFDKPFLILRNQYLFSRASIAIKSFDSQEAKIDDSQIIFNFIKAERAKSRYPTEPVVIAHFMSTASISEARIKRAISNLCYHGHEGLKLLKVDHPIDLTTKDKPFLIVDLNGSEVITNG